MEHKTLSFRNQETKGKLQSPLPERLHRKWIIKTKQGWTKIKGSSLYFEGKSLNFVTKTDNIPPKTSNLVRKTDKVVCKVLDFLLESNE